MVSGTSDTFIKSKGSLSNSHVELFLSPLTVLMALSGISIYKNKFQFVSLVFTCLHTLVTTYFPNFITTYSVPKSTMGPRLLSLQTDGLLKALKPAQYFFTFPLSGKPYSSFVTKSNSNSSMKSFSSMSLACNIFQC